MISKIKRCERGVTLFEILIVVGLIAVIAAVFLPTFFDLLMNYRSETAVEQITMNLRFARMAAVKKRRSYQVLFNAEPTNTYEVRMDEDRNGSFEPYKNADTTLAGGMKILSGGITSVTFNGRGAATIVSGGPQTIRVRSAEDFVYRINVFTNGAVTKERE